MIVNAHCRVIARRIFTALCLVVFLARPVQVYCAQASAGLTAHLQQLFGLNESQVHGALGTLLVYARERLPKPDFDDLAERMPRADIAMQSVKSQGIVTRPLDSRSDYEKALSKVGIPSSLAPKFAPAVIDYLGAAGYTREHDMLARVFD
jgi:hypothetical protein